MYIYIIPLSLSLSPPRVGKAFRGASSTFFRVRCWPGEGAPRR